MSALTTDTCRLRVLALDGKEILLEAEPQCSVSELKIRLEAECGTPPKEQALTHDTVVLADDVQIKDVCSKAGELAHVELTLVRKVFVLLLCAEALTEFKAKNLTDGDIKVSVARVTKTVAAGEVWTYAKPDFWDGKYFELDVMDPEKGGTAGTIACENGGPERQLFKVQASDDFGHEEHWLMHFAVSGNDTWATISSAPEGR
eukprot:TRINITY_DN25139_c0_g2_i1.p1 TRINITY_DN25139_c0_g2~~TRINITY_DN25139_c0_g2_i1.p1  ORF type:complete len:203 (-),score=35.96 TRINITY_DN25139_c0_g2_i1:87-695(-)